MDLPVQIDPEDISINSDATLALRDPALRLLAAAQASDTEGTLRLRNTWCVNGGCTGGTANSGCNNIGC